MSSRDSQNAAGRPKLTPEQEKKLFEAVGRRVIAVVCHRPPERFGSAVADIADTLLYGSFVSLKRRGQLRSCCGALNLDSPLAELVSHAADRSATDDPRFPPIQPDELSELDMEVWLLWSPEEMQVKGEDRVKEVEIGKYGLQVARGSQRGLLLPAVATEHGFDARTFLDQTCIKAGLPPKAWLDDATKVMRFEGYAIRGPLASLLTVEPAKNRDQIEKFIAAFPEERKPAVAGAFYPGNAVEIQKMLDKMLPATPPALQQWPAIMVPHAGWIYSGKIAAAVWSRVKIPSHVIMLCPAHRGGGAAWAVAPHKRWLLPDGAVQSDRDLAVHLATNISGLELDDAPHRQEHAIEVQLPFVARLAPQAKVVGITIGGGTLLDLLRFGAQLADAVKDLPERPLLVISSDLNHFADDAENRILDRIALDAVETLNPTHLYETVRMHRISMCGVFPAVIIMETLRRLNLLNRSELVDYGTSAEASGDRTRVVGYAGMLFG